MRQRFRLNHGWLICFLLIITLFFQKTLSAEPKNPQEYLLEININQENTQQLLNCFIDLDDQLWIAQRDMEKWHLPLSKEPPWKYNNNHFYPLSSIKGIQYKLDKSTLTLDLTIPPSYLPMITVGPTSKEKTGYIRPKDAGAFINYGVSLQHDNNHAQNNVAAYTEWGYFNPYGVGTSDFVFNNANFRDNKLVRLNTTWTIDRPENITSWYFGDSVTRAASWSGAVRFGGIQWQSNFDTQPYFTTFPLPSFSGEAIVPTTLKLFVNDAPRFTEKVKSGPFTVRNLPVVTGQGTVTMVSQNILGHQQEFTIPYYVSEQLLQPGLEDFSYEIGFIRRDYGIENFNYAHLASVATHRKGINPWWTVGWHGEILARQQTFGLSSDYLWNNFIVVSTAVAGSHSRLGTGELLLLGLRRQTHRLSFGGQGIISSKKFTELGISPERTSPFLRLQAYISYASSHWGSGGISYTLVKNAGEDCENDFGAIVTYPNAQLLTLSYSRNIVANMNMLVSSVLDLHRGRNNNTFISFIWALEGGKSLHANANFQPDDHTQTLVLNKNLPWGNGYGYRVAATHGSPNGGEAYLAYQNDYGTYSGRVLQYGDYTNYFGQASGSIIHFDSHILLSRATYNSFALVEVPGFENICVYDRNVCIGRTNKEGILLVPNLLPYQYNKIAIEPKDLPVNTEMPINELNIMPYYRSGVLTIFPVKKVYNLTLRLLNTSKQPLPTGTLVTIRDSDNVYPVGENGYFFVATSNTRVQGNARWNGGECNFTLSVPKSDNGMIEMGDIICY